ncbi:uncharacterized protein N0V89_012489 [Didymosphaeria variabile]|uniref:Uncharacterized protein n=1 Tax=Didymosphaeria variabile TaxID=1932322 RepID=A0A9W9C667_9PLEO|nr:uncharacterized protein N0V89_012489 [Didymosphaeria variabile]KAJ4344745.1 hypothetical protein N0V89_012489 [Didymosphaeria variabile]
MSFSAIAGDASAGVKPLLAKDLPTQAFPADLVEKVTFSLSRLHERMESVHYAETGPRDRPPSKDDRHKFTLWHGTASSKHVKLPGDFAFREAADLALMSLFGFAFAAKLQHDVENWPKLDDIDNAANPGGFFPQFVGRKEAGWALDQHGCLALTVVQGDELLWYYVKAEVGDDQAPLPAGNDLPIDPLPEQNKPSGFKKFSLKALKRC